MMTGAQVSQKWEIFRSSLGHFLPRKTKGSLGFLTEPGVSLSSRGHLKCKPPSRLKTKFHPQNPREKPWCGHVCCKVSAEEGETIPGAHRPISLDYPETSRTMSDPVSRKKVGSAEE